MKFKKTLVLVMVLIFAICVCVACQDKTSDTQTKADVTKSDKSNEGLRVGYSTMANNMPFRIAETESMKAVAKERGFELVFCDAQGSTSKQVSDIEDLIAQGVDYIVMTPQEYEGFEAVLDKAKEAGIPVIQSSTGSAGYRETYVAADFYLEGQEACQWLAEHTEKDNMNIVQLIGIPGGDCAQKRQAGFEDKMKEYPNFNIISSQVANFTRNEGQSVMANIIQAEGDNIDAIYAHNDEMALGAIQALKAAGYEPGKDVMIVSIDGEKDGIAAIKAGEINAIVQCPPQKGPWVFDAIESLEKGESVEDIITPEHVIFDQDNIDETAHLAF